MLLFEALKRPFFLTFDLLVHMRKGHKMPYKNALCVYPHKKGLPEKKYCPPFGLEYIATVLEGLVESVTLVDMRFEPNLDDFLPEFCT